MSQIDCLASEFGWQISYKNVKNINFRVRAGVVKISLPRRCDSAHAAAAILARKDWLLLTAARQQEVLKRQAAKRLEASNQGLFSLWGEQIAASDARAAAMQARAQAAQWLSEHGAQELASSVQSAALAKQIAAGQDFCQQKAAFYARELELIGFAYARFYARALGVQIASLKLTRARRVWGNCSKQRAQIRLALQLASQPQECVRYVALHECAHLLEANHSAAFWAHVRSQMSDFARVQARLRTPEDYDI